LFFVRPGIKPHDLRFAVLKIGTGKKVRADHLQAIAFVKCARAAAVEFAFVIFLLAYAGLRRCRVYHGLGRISFCEDRLIFPVVGFLATERGALGFLPCEIKSLSRVLI
jgi:hypothetical protein